MSIPPSSPGPSIEPCLQVSDCLTVPYDDVGVDVGASESENHLFTSERLPIPIPSHIRVRMPSNKEVNVVRVADRMVSAPRRGVSGARTAPRYGG